MKTTTAMKTIATAKEIKYAKELRDRWNESQKFTIPYAQTTLELKGYIPHKIKGEWIRVVSPDGSRFHIRLLTKHLIAIHYDAMRGFHHAVIPTSRVKKEVNRLLL